MKPDIIANLAREAKKVTGLTFRNKRLLAGALIHPSYRNENKTPKLRDFDRLEFFGDAILNYVICKKLFRVFPIANEGILSRLRSTLVSRKILARITCENKFHNLFLLGKSLKSQPLKTKTKLLADCIESLIAAIYFDRGITAAEKFILKHYATYFDLRRLTRLDPNPKSTLQELVQKGWQKLPVYTHRHTKQGVKVTVTIGKSKKVTAQARSKQDAELKAARAMIKKLRQVKAARSKRKSSPKK